MGARITVNVTAGGVLEVWLNEEGRDLLVRELQSLDAKHDHLHLAPEGMGDVGVSTRPYRPDDKVLDWGKIYFRLDEWDQKYFPHVMSERT